MALILNSNMLIWGVCKCKERKVSTYATAAKKENEPRSSRVHSRADNEPNPQPRCRQQMLHGLTEVTVAVMIIPHHTLYPPIAGVALLTKAKVNESPIWAAGKLKPASKTELSQKVIAELKGRPISLMSVPLYYPSWEKVPKERKAAIISNIGTLFDLRPHMESSCWTEIYEGINIHLQKAYNTNKASFKAKHWKAGPTTESYDVEGSGGHVPRRLQRLSGINTFGFGMIPRTLLEPLKSAIKYLAKERGLIRQDPGRWSLRDEMEEMKRLEATGEYSEDEINALARGSDSISDMFKEFESGGASGSGGCGDDEESGDDEDGEDEDDDGER
ncbi:hypothetical protein Tco_0494420 [Tanacetum coccineum]